MKILNSVLRKHRWFLAVLVSQIPLVILTLNSFAPLSYGWFLVWAEQSRHLTPYKDFFMPFPFVGVWLLGSLPNLFAQRIMAESIISGILWLAFVSSQYLLTSLLWAKKHAALGTIFGAFFLFALPIDKLAGYYETMVMFLAFGVYLLSRALGSTKHSKLWALLGGISLAIAPFIKQNAVIPSICIISFVIYKTTRVGRRDLIRPAAVGYLLIPAFSCLYALQGHFLSSFLAGMLTGGGKHRRCYGVLTGE